VENACRTLGFDVCWLSQLLRAAAPAELQAGLNEEVLSDELLDQLTASAAKWYHGAGGARIGAEKYYRMNLVEKRAVQAAFPRTIFATFNSSKFRSLFPDRLPIFYMYSIKRGFSVKPWFLSDSELAEYMMERPGHG
jgi:hypothetical protein